MKKNIISSVLVSLPVLVLYVFWFVISDCRLTFLYGHLHTTPYDADTLGRYFMTALVAGGVVFVFYTLVNLILKKIKRGYKLPDWKKVWQYSCLVFVPLFVCLKFFGQPPLSMLISLWVVLGLAVSLRLALYLGNYVVNNFKQAIFTFLDGVGFAPTLILTPLAIAYGVRKDSLFHLVVFPLAAIIGGLIWLGIMTLVQKKLKRVFSAPKNILLAALAITYLLSPLLHYLISRPEHLYISNLDNFFAADFGRQLLTFALAVAMLELVSCWRRNDDWRSLRATLTILVLMSGINYGVLYLEADKNPNVWICENDQWVKQGEPAYAQPFPEECGMIDKIIMAGAVLPNFSGRQEKIADVVNEKYSEVWQDLQEETMFIYGYEPTTKTWFELGSFAVPPDLLDDQHIATMLQDIPATAISHDGRKIVYRDAQSLQVRDLETWEIIAETASLAAEAKIWNWYFSFDDEKLMMDEAKQPFHLWDLETGEITTYNPETGENEHWHQAGWLPNGLYVAQRMDYNPEQPFQIALIDPQNNQMEVVDMEEKFPELAVMQMSSAMAIENENKLILRGMESELFESKALEAETLTTREEHEALEKEFAESWRQWLYDLEQQTLRELSPGEEYYEQ